LIKEFGCAPNIKGNFVVNHYCILHAWEVMLLYLVHALIQQYFFLTA